VASAALRRLAWPAAAVATAAFIVALAMHGERPEPGLARFVAAGLMTVPPERVTEVDLDAGGRSWRLRRSEDGWAVVHGGPLRIADPRPQVEEGLALLHRSGPQRILTPDEAAGAERDFGLAAPALSVTARTTSDPPFTIHFGGKNPLGLARYARVDGRAEVVLLPAFVAEAWERLVTQP
jgi:hypothetical protein